jgi:hypothetical protein
MAALDRSDFIQVTLHHFRNFINEAHQSKKQLQRRPILAETALGLIKKGIWTPEDHYLALKTFKARMNTPERLAGLVANGATYNGYLPRDFFELILDDSFPGGKEAFTFTIKKGKNPSEALDAIPLEACMLNTAGVREVAVYFALRDLLGVDKFNHLFAADSDTPLIINADRNRGIQRLFDRIVIQKKQEVRPGDFCFFTQVDTHLAKHPGASERGYHGICERLTGEGPLFLALRLSPQGSTVTEVEQVLLEDLNADPMEEAFLHPSIWYRLRTEYLCKDEEASKKHAASHAKVKMTWEEFRAAPPVLGKEKNLFEDKLRLCIYRPSYLRVEMLIQTPLAHIRAVYKSLKSG